MRLQKLLLFVGFCCRPVRTWLKLISLGCLPLLLGGDKVPLELQKLVGSIFTPFLLLVASEQVVQRVAPDQWRSLRVWSRILPIYTAYMWTKHTATTDRGLDEDTVQRRWDVRHEWGGKKVQALVSAMNGFYVKSAQVMASKTEMLPPQWCSRLSHHWDNMPPRPWKRVLPAVLKNLRASQAKTLLHPKPHPAGATGHDSQDNSRLHLDSQRQISSSSIPHGEAHLERPDVGETGRREAVAPASVPGSRSQTSSSSSSAAAQVQMSDVFEIVEPVALAAASIAQVHGAVLTDGVVEVLTEAMGWEHGREVVLKVQYPDVKVLMVTDLRNLSRVAAFLNPVLPFDARPLVKQMQKVVPEEFNFLREARVMSRIKARLDTAGLPHPIVIPKPIPALSSIEMIVMQRVTGTPLTRILEAGPEQEGPLWDHAKAAMIHLLHAYGQMIFVDGLFHADPHPGNLLVQDDGRLVLLDFGQCQALRLQQQKSMCHLIIALRHNDPLAMLAAISTYGLKFGPSALANGLDLTAIYKMLLIMFDTRFVPEGMQSPFGRGAVVEGAPVEELPGELYQLCRMVLILRGVFYQLGLDVASADVWYPYAVKALADGRRMAAVAEQNKEFVVE